MSSLTNARVTILRNAFLDRDVSACVELTDETSGNLLLRFERAVQCDGKTYRYAVATPRHSVGNVSVSCSIIWVPDDKFDAENPMDVKWWRGGGATISDIRIRYPD